MNFRHIVHRPFPFNPNSERMNSISVTTLLSPLQNGENPYSFLQNLLRSELFPSSSGTIVGLCFAFSALLIMSVYSRPCVPKLIVRAEISSAVCFACSCDFDAESDSSTTSLDQMMARTSRGTGKSFCSLVGQNSNSLFSRLSNGLLWSCIYAVISMSFIWQLFKTTGSPVNHSLWLVRDSRSIRFSQVDISIA